MKQHKILWPSLFFFLWFILSCAGGVSLGLPKEKRWSGTLKLSYPDGTPRAFIPLQRGVPHGKVRFFHSNGKLRSKTNYQNGEIYGKEIRYYASGQIAEESIHENGVKVPGLFKSFDSSGNSTNNWTSVYGFRSGTLKRHLENGGRKSTEFEYNIRDGWDREWYPNGELKYERFYYNGNENITKYRIQDENGRVINHWISGVGKRSGKMKYLYPDSSIMIRSEYKHGERHGWEERYTPDKKLLSRVLYRFGKVQSKDAMHSPKAPKLPDEDRDRFSILETFRKNSRSLKAIYHLHNKKTPFRGTIKVQLNIKINGDVSKVLCLQETTGHPAFVENILTEIFQWRFSPSQGKSIQLSVPLDFSE